ncbi:MAG: hypothetical protein CMF59_14970 [Leptospiraceae bacterium]|nr:hypothetical protein [Leptospiraceae bacterium]
MPQELIILLLTICFLLLVAALFFLASWMRSKLQPSAKLEGSLLELRKWIPDLQPMQIGSDYYGMGTFQGHRIGFRRWTGKALAIRVKIRETEMDPFYLLALSGGSPPEEGFHNMRPGLYLGSLSGVSFDEQKEKYNRLLPATLASIQTLAQNVSSLTVGPDWEVNRIGRDAALRLLGQDGVALTQLELRTVISDNYSGEALLSHIKKMCHIVERLERELPRE